MGCGVCSVLVAPMFSSHYTYVSSTLVCEAHTQFVHVSLQVEEVGAGPWALGKPSQYNGAYVRMFNITLRLHLYIAK